MRQDEQIKGDNVSASTRLEEHTINDKLQELDIEFVEGISGVVAVSPVITDRVKLTSGKYEAKIQVTGLDVSLMEVFGYDVYEGRLPEENDDFNLFFGITAVESFDEVEASNAKVASTSGPSNAPVSQVPSQNGGGEPVKDEGQGKDAVEPPPKEEEKEEEEEEEVILDVDVFSDRITMTLDTSYSPQGGTTSSEADIHRITGIGLLEEGDGKRDETAYMAIDNLLELIDDYDDAKGNETDEGYDSAYVLAADMEDVDTIAEYIEDYDYKTSTSSDFLETMQGTAQTLTIALGAIGAVSLLVAAIGITNTMNMAIHERKKEIGVMKVIGATINDIRRLFLVESAIMGFFGGVFGISFSYAAALVISSGMFSSVASGDGIDARNPMSTFSTFSVVLPEWLLIAGLIGTTMIGVISGFLPARKAVKSSALEAIKTE